jgi:hypothetical protein
MKILNVLILGFCFSLLSCKPADNAKKDFLQWAEKGKIIDKVICKDDQSLSYSLYIPSGYDLDHLWPIIYCFDPKGDGKLPVSLFKDIAEKRGYIIVGSNDSKNGTDAGYLNQIINSLFSDTKSKLSIDDKRIYVAGFSGGSRVATACALSYPNVAGVIGCSAGYQPSEGQPNFYFIGMAGDSDMNYLEMKMLDLELEKMSKPHEFNVFEGKHHWPPKQYLADAVLSFDLLAMKMQNIPIDKQLINSMLKLKLSNIENLEKSTNLDSLLKAHEIIKNAITEFSGLIDVSELMKNLNSLDNNSELTQYINKQNSIESEEVKMQQIFIDAFKNENISWWKSEIKKLTAVSQTGKSSLERLSAIRQMAFISLVSYSYVSSVIAQNNWNAAANFLIIYGLSDPENPDYHYFNACAFANKGKINEAIAEIESSIKYGFIDKQKLLTDNKLLTLHDNPKFNEVVNRLK